MKKDFSLGLGLLLIYSSILLMACQTKQAHHPLSEDSLIPEAPNYADSTQWYMTDREADADLFYITSTETGDYVLADGSTCHFADTYNDSLRIPIYREMLGVENLLSDSFNYFSPYYRQCSLQTFVSDSTMNERLPIAIDDVKRAFQHYLRYQNNGRSFILAGYSQGAMILLELLKEMDADTYHRMIAAYVIGASVPQEMVDECPRIVPAQGEGDTGVTICYNSVRDASCSMFTKSAFAINPVNWETDTTSAVLITVPSPQLPISEQKTDTLKVWLDPSTELVYVEGFTGTDYQLPLIGQEGNYHSREIWLYRESLSENMSYRAEQFMKKRTSN